MLRRAAAARVTAAIFAGATAFTIAHMSPGQLKESPTKKIEWAWPHPYEGGGDEEGEDDDTEEQRFVEPQPFLQTKNTWNLPALVERWKTSDGEETWPWVWTWHNPRGPHKVFCGVDPSGETLQVAKSFAAASPQHNLTLVVESVDDIARAGFTEADFYEQRCAIIESAPSQIDMGAKILMLEDERIICYDSLHFA